MLIPLAIIVVCWAYPLTRTSQAITSKSFDGLWPVYWMSLGLLSYIESHLIWWMSCSIVYGVFKSLFCLWMYHEDYRGAEWLEENVIRGVYPQVVGLLEATPLKFLISS